MDKNQYIGRIYLRKSLKTYKKNQKSGRNDINEKSQKSTKVKQKSIKRFILFLAVITAVPEMCKNALTATSAQTLLTAISPSRFKRFSKSKTYNCAITTDNKLIYTGKSNFQQQKKLIFSQNKGLPFSPLSRHNPENHNSR